MTTMAQQEAEHILRTYSSTILEAARKQESRGRLRYYHHNLFTYIDINNNFSYEITDILAPLGFTLVPIMHKKHSPKSHISMMTNHEQDNIVERHCVYFTYYKWRKVDFNLRLKTFRCQPRGISSQAE